MNIEKNAEDRTLIQSELHDVALVLDQCLTRLDTIGAGIAAVHVNAAIEHLNTLLLCPESDPQTGVSTNNPGDDCTRSEDARNAFDSSLVCICGGSHSTH